jgi:hypothetical protein
MNIFLILRASLDAAAPRKSNAMLMLAARFRLRLGTSSCARWNDRRHVLE